MDDIDQWNKNVDNAYEDLIEGGDYEFLVDRLLQLHYDDFCTLEALMWLGRDTRPRNRLEALEDFGDFVDHAFGFSPRGTTKVPYIAAEYVAAKTGLTKYLMQGKAYLDGTAEYHKSKEY